MDDDRPRTQNGRYAAKVEDADILAAVRAHSPAATSEIADEVGITRQGADRRLRSLRDEGRVASKKIAASLVWFIPNDTGGTAPSPAPPERREVPATPVDDTEIDPTDEPPEPTDAPREPAHDDVDDEGASATGESPEIDLSTVEVPGQGKKAEFRREAVGAALAYIRDRDTATPADIQDAIYPDHPAGYTAGDDPANSWWKNCIYPALRQIAERDDRLRKADTSGDWTWEGAQ